MASFVFKFGAQPLQTELAGKTDTLMAAFAAQMDTLGQQLYALVADKLSGGVLKVQTGELLRSVMLNALAITGMQFETSVEIPESSPQWIVGMTHEYGGTGYYQILPVNAQALRFMVGGNPVFAKSVNHPPAVERSFLRSSLDEIQAEVYADLSKTATEVLGAN